MARFKKNARGYYQTGVTLGYDERGRVKRKWLYAKTIAELEEKLRAADTARAMRVNCFMSISATGTRLSLRRVQSKSCRS